MEYTKILNYGPYDVEKIEKNAILVETLNELTIKHYRQSLQYKNILDSISYKNNPINSLNKIPFLPVSIFKELNLKSISEQDVFKTMTSSGTTGQKVSKIYLDKTTASNQQKTLVNIVKDFTGTSRMPMLIIDTPSVLQNRDMFSARGAGILGFSIFGTDKTYALNEDMSLNIEVIHSFLLKHRNERIFLFGFTFMIWKYFYKEILKKGYKIDLINSVMIHGGGWKKMHDESVSSEIFKKSFFEQTGMTNIHDYYGMVEQTGCIYMECEENFFHASTYSDILIRNPFDFSVCPTGEKGIIQVLSMLPESYPGHSLLTEDEGIIFGEDDCKCGRKGKYFKILGRLENSEIRGCSDTHEE